MSASTGSIATKTYSFPDSNPQKETFSAGKSTLSSTARQENGIQDLTIGIKL